MERTTVVHVRTPDAKGAAYCGRGPNGRHMASTPIGKRGWLGNPFVVGLNGVADAIAAFRVAFSRRVDSDPRFREAVLELRGRRLACFCHPEPCHADVIAEWIDAQSIDEATGDAAGA